MNKQISEADWKLWRNLSKQALERYCNRILQDVSKYATGTESAHARYLKLFKHIEHCDKIIADVFNDSRRSNAINRIAIAIGKGLISRDELATFSEETQALVKLWLDEYR